MSRSGTKVNDEDRQMVNGSELTREIGVDENEIAWRKEYTQFSAEDAATLESVSELFDEIADEIDEIAAANQQQAAQIQEITQTVNKPTNN